MKRASSEILAECRQKRKQRCVIGATLAEIPEPPMKAECSISNTEQVSVSMPKSKWVRARMKRKTKLEILQQLTATYISAAPEILAQGTMEQEAEQAERDLSLKIEHSRPVTDAHVSISTPRHCANDSTDQLNNLSQELFDESVIDVSERDQGESCKDLGEQGWNDEDTTEKDGSDEDEKEQDASDEDVRKQDGNDKNVREQVGSDDEVREQKGNDEDMKDQDVSDEDVTEQDECDDDVTQQGWNDEDVREQGGSDEDDKEQDVRAEVEREQDENDEDVREEDENDEDVREQDENDDGVREEDENDEDVREQDENDEGVRELDDEDVRELDESDDDVRELDESDDDLRQQGGSDDDVRQQSEGDEDVRQQGVRDEDVRQQDGSDINKNNLLLLALKLKHKLTSSAVEDIAKLVNFISGGENVAQSKYLLNKSFASATIDGSQYHHICRHCNTYIGLAINGMLQCPNNLCNQRESHHLHHNSFFMYLPLQKQLTDLMENGEISSHFLESKRAPSGNICDIFDGELYRKNMPESEDINLSLTFNCDGVPIFKSSSCCIWPILCTINELPPEMRRKHVMLVSLWFGSEKPNMNIYFEPFVAEITQLSNDGFAWVNPVDHRELQIKVKLLLGVCDTVARPLLQNMKQFNGKHGCGFCMDAGIVVKKGNGFTRAYPYQHDSVLRTDKSTDILVERVMQSNSEIEGVKGISILSLVPCFNVIDGFVPDYMHCTLLGVTRQLVYLWFDSHSHAEPFYLGGERKAIDDLLLSIKPPCNISRVPRSLKLRKFWKAHEWYNWLLFYSLPILKLFLPGKFFKHWALLVEGVSLLLGTSISSTVLDHCELIMTQFVYEMKLLYGVNQCSFNVHLCLHLTKSVRNWGPLWSHSSFIFEDYNGQLVEMFKGSQAVPLQICQTFLLQKAIPVLAKNVVKSERCSDEYSKVLKSFTSRETRMEHATTLNDVTVLGTPKIQKLNDEHRLAMFYISRQFDVNATVKYFNRIIMRGEMLHSLKYCRNLKRNSHVVELVNGDIFVIEIFVVVDLEGANVCCAIGHYLEIVVNKLATNDVEEISLRHLISVKRIYDPCVVAIRTENIKSKCILVKLLRYPYDIVCKQLNCFEYCA